MDRHPRELVRHKAGSGEYECQRIRADDSTRRTLNIRVVEIEGAELTNVVPGEELLEIQAGKGASSRSASDGRGTSSSKPRGAVEGNGATGEFQRETDIHHDCDSDLIHGGIVHGDSAHGAGNTEVVRRE